MPDSAPVGKFTVRPGTATVSVSITGDNPTAWTSQAATATHTLPKTISANTDFWMVRGTYTVTTTMSGVTIDTSTVTIDNGTGATIDPKADTLSELASLLGAGSGASSPGASRWLGPCKIGCFDGQQVFLAANATDVSGGTFTLTLNGHTTAAIAHDANAAAIQAALEALTGIGVGNVDVTGDDLGAGTTVAVTVHDALATGLMTADCTNLTGPSSPYTATIVGATSWTVPMLTPAVGDIIEDFLHNIVTPFAEGGKLDYTDTPADPQGSAPEWSVPSAEWSLDGLDLSGTNGFTNVSGLGASDATSQPTALAGLIAAGIARQSGAGHAGEGYYGVLPVVMLNSVPIYSAAYNVDPAPSAGEVWIWVKTATPAAAA